MNTIAVAATPVVLLALRDPIGTAGTPRLHAGIAGPA